MNYIKNNQITSSPIITNIINPSHAQILENGFFVYIDNQPEYNTDTQRIEKTEVIEGVQQYAIIDLTQEEIRKRTLPYSITQGQGKLTLLAMGLLPTVEHIVSQAGEEERIYWEYWATWTRDSVILNRIAPMIGWGDSELDEFFVKASSFV
jgi:hypothetical protein